MNDMQKGKADMSVKLRGYGSKEKMPNLKNIKKGHAEYCREPVPVV